jgi:hypothetical protein
MSDGFYSSNKDFLYMRGTKLPRQKSSRRASKKYCQGRGIEAGEFATHFLSFWQLLRIDPEKIPYCLLSYFDQSIAR